LVVNGPTKKSTLLHCLMKRSFWLTAERYNKQHSQTISMEQYLAASKVLDTAPEGSPEWLTAEKIVNAYESGN